jgi:hypothetical protein
MAKAKSTTRPKKLKPLRKHKDPCVLAEARRRKRQFWMTGELINVR